MKELNEIDEIVNYIYKNISIIPQEIRNSMKDKVNEKITKNIQSILKEGQNPIGEVQKYIDFLSEEDINKIITCVESKKYTGQDLIERKKFNDEKKDILNRLSLFKQIKENKGKQMKEENTENIKQNNNDEINRS